MRRNCRECRNGIIIETTTCPECKGTGSNKITIGIGESRGDDCTTCNGKGKLVNKSTCSECQDGYVYNCDFCGNTINQNEGNVCATCEENPIVIQLGQPLDYRYLDGKNALAGKVKTSTPKSVQVDLGNGFLGFFKPYQNARYRVGQVIPIRLRNPLTREDRGNAVPVMTIRAENKYKIITKSQPVHDLSIDELMEKVGNIGKIQGQIIDIYAMKNGLTLFTIIDNKGKSVQGSVYGIEGKRAYPSISVNTVVNAVARYKIINEKDRLQIYSLERVKGNEVFEFFDDLAKYSITDGKPIEETEFFIESANYDKLRPNFASAAVRIRNAALRNQNIIMRYHSPCIDGASAVFAIDFGIKQFLVAKGARHDDFKRLIRRIPQRNEIFEVREVVRDLAFALDDGTNYRNMPLYILVDVGSSDDSKAALSICKSYGVDVIVIDTHHLDKDVSDLPHSIVNSNLIDDNENITTAMLSVELTKFIAPEVDLSANIIQLAALSGISDEVSGTEFEKYVELAKNNEFDLTRLQNINSALDYVIFGLRHFDGGEVIRNILSVSGPVERTSELIESITPTAKSLFATSLKIVEANAQTEEINGKLYVSIDLDNFAPRYEYPSHSSLISALHNKKVEEEEKLVLTVGYSGDYLLLKNSAMEFNFNEFLTELQEEYLEMGISGSGSKYKGSIQFLSGHREKIIEAIKKLL